MLNQENQKIYFMKLNREITEQNQNALYHQIQRLLDITIRLYLAEKCLFSPILKRNIKIKNTVFSFPCCISKSASTRQNRHCWETLSWLSATGFPLGWSESAKQDWLYLINAFLPKEWWPNRGLLIINTSSWQVCSQCPLHWEYLLPPR